MCFCDFVHVAVATKGIIEVGCKGRVVGYNTEQRRIAVRFKNHEHAKGCSLHDISKSPPSSDKNDVKTNHSGIYNSRHACRTSWT